jgi:hypothetical protein
MKSFYNFSKDEEYAKLERKKDARADHYRMEKVIV